MNLTIDFRSDLPIYLQIVEQIKQMVLQGVIKPDDQLPTVRALATDLRVNFNTIARAYRVLDQAGLISTQKGRGTYILGVPNQETVKFICEKTLEEITRKYLEEVRSYGCSDQEILKVIQKELMNPVHNSQEEQND